ncbi:unnamed protein product [Adineta ricciae]|uniref:G-protein coupled receptors family 1 profile domain-containing protein n=1 Tax=Adineta ricciae TaxID=249248 RepID=A0A814IJV8_ADIRI|nr:unnamed protein product [Adineta ricciae]CAF1069888.1 unnamed protein product [Adineta ricciae]
MIVNNTLGYAIEQDDVSLSRTVRFWIFLILIVPSVYCSFLVLFHLFVDKNLRSQLGNHIVINLLIIGLITEFVDIPFHLVFLQTGRVQPSTPALCLAWWFFDLGLYNGCTVIMAWSSVHRYFLIFHSRLFRTANNRFLFHYLPLILLNIYIVLFYFIVIMFPPCVNIYNYSLPVCNNFPCYLNDPLLGIWDSVANGICPTLITTISSITVLCRVYYQKMRLQQINLWRKQRKMTIQLLSVCILYLIANIPLNVMIFAHLCGLPQVVGASEESYFNYLCYFVTLLFPFVCLGILAELKKKIQWKGIFLFRRSLQIGMIHPQ